MRRIKYHSIFPRLLKFSSQSFSDVHVILNLTVMSGGSKELEVFILYDLCREVFS